LPVGLAHRLVAAVAEHAAEGAVHPQHDAVVVQLEIAVADALQYRLVARFALFQAGEHPIDFTGQLADFVRAEVAQARQPRGAADAGDFLIEAPHAADDPDFQRQVGQQQGGQGDQQGHAEEQPGGFLALLEGSARLALEAELRLAGGTQVEQGGLLRVGVRHRRGLSSSRRRGRGCSAAASLPRPPFPAAPASASPSVPGGTAGGAGRAGSPR
jgi:hypothetical protein